MLSFDAQGKYLLKLVSGCTILLLSFSPTVQKYLLKQSQISLLSVKSRGLIITRKGAALRLRAYIAVSPQIHCSPSSFISYQHKLKLQIRQPGERQKTCIRVK